MNAEEYEHAWFWEKPKSFCKIMEEHLSKAFKDAEKKAFPEHGNINLFKTVRDDNNLSKN